MVLQQQPPDQTEKPAILSKGVKTIEPLSNNLQPSSPSQPPSMTDQVVSPSIPNTPVVGVISGQSPQSSSISMNEASAAPQVINQPPPANQATVVSAEPEALATTPDISKGKLKIGSKTLLIAAICTIAGLNLVGLIISIVDSGHAQLTYRIIFILDVLVGAGIILKTKSTSA